MTDHDNCHRKSFRTYLKKFRNQESVKSYEASKSGFQTLKSQF